MCRRPAVSTRTTSTPARAPSTTASKATLAGSAPSRPADDRRSRRAWPSLQLLDGRGAEGVGRRTISTVLPSPTGRGASLPMVVVLPVPLTPTIIHTAGAPLCFSSLRVRSRSSPIWPISSVRSSPRTWSTSRTPSTLTLVRRSSTICRAGTTPTSAVIRTSSISSQVSSSSRSRDSRPSSTEPIDDWDRASRSRSRTSRPADGGGFSISGAGGAGARDGAGGAMTSPTASAAPSPGVRSSSWPGASGGVTTWTGSPRRGAGAGPAAASPPRARGRRR